MGAILATMAPPVDPTAASRAAPPATLLTVLLAALLAGTAAGANGGERPLAARDIHTRLAGDPANTAAGLGLEGDGPLEDAVVWEAGREGRDARVAKLLSPSDKALESLVGSLPKERRLLFLKNFLGGYLPKAGPYRFVRLSENQVAMTAVAQDATGRTRAIDLRGIRGILGGADPAKAPPAKLEEAWRRWLSSTGGRPFSFLTPAAAGGLFYGLLPGMRGRGFHNSAKAFPYEDWLPQFGDPETMVKKTASFGEGGWDLDFLPSRSFGALDNATGELRIVSDNDPRQNKFAGPGWNRMTFDLPRRPPEGRLPELLRAAQALSVLRSLENDVFFDQCAHGLPPASDRALGCLAPDLETVVSVKEGGAGGEGPFGVEFRTDLLDHRTLGLLQSLVASRVVADDWSGLADFPSWSLIRTDGNPFPFPDLAKDSLAARFDVDEAHAERALDVLLGGRKKQILKRQEEGDLLKVQVVERSISGHRADWIAPLWNWTGDGTPFMGDGKRGLVKALTKDFILQVAALDPEHKMKNAYVKSLIHQWAQGSGIAEDVEEYLRPPAPRVSRTAGTAPRAEGGPADRIPLSLTYTGRTPLRSTKTSLQDPSTGKRAWASTPITMTEAERRRLVEDIADDLAAFAGGGARTVEKDSWDAIVHRIDDGDGSWVVAWEMPQRQYDVGGAVVKDSVSHGRIRVSTPFGRSGAREAQAVHGILRKHNVVQADEWGGEGVALDASSLSPRRTARLLSVFLAHRGIVSLMFQPLGNALRGAPPLPVDAAFAGRLRNFKGGRKKLARLLYEGRHFNRRFGMPPRLSQLDMTAALRRAAPPDLLGGEGDPRNPMVPWKRRFSPDDPPSGVLAFRLLGTPGDPLEAGLKTGLVRAMLARALGDEPLKEGVQEVDHAGYLRDARLAWAHLAALCDDLKLPCRDYMGAVGEGLGRMWAAARSREPLQTNLPPEVESGWDGRGDGPAEEPGSVERMNAGRAARSRREAWLREEAFPDNASRTKPGVLRRTASPQDPCRRRWSGLFTDLAGGR